ncbi:MAG: hypothetical protein Ct9H90mP1_2610 [Methanobacteriota archaeon]|nr:MAG: hypothetical protein Ct9H90mP1_2610 [Euryarchaeota archaeon]
MIDTSDYNGHASVCAIRLIGIARLLDDRDVHFAEDLVHDPPSSYSTNLRLRLQYDSVADHVKSDSLDIVRNYVVPSIYRC